MKNILKIGILILLVSSCTSNLVINSVNNNTKCSEKGGYWYNNKCWTDYEDEGISETKIDSVVDLQMELLERSKFKIDNKTYPLVGFSPIDNDEGVFLLTVYGSKNDYKTLIIPLGNKEISNGVIETTCLFFLGNALSDSMEKDPVAQGHASVNVIDMENFNIEIKGTLSSLIDDRVTDFEFKPNESVSGGGNSELEIKENIAYLSGVLGTRTYVQIKNLIKTKPEIKTIVLTNISGSVNDAVNMHTGRLVRENGFTTKVLSDSDIASGGVDLFCAGKERIVEKGAKIGVHSWCCINNLSAIEIPKEHPAHQYQLEYFTMALGAEKGPAFYFYTLEAAPFDNIHYMTDNEIKKWDIATEFIEN